MDSDVRRHITLSEAAKLLDVWPATVRNRVARGAYAGSPLPPGEWAIDARAVVRDALAYGQPLVPLVGLKAVTGVDKKSLRRGSPVRDHPELGELAEVLLEQLPDAATA